MRESEFPEARGRAIVMERSGGVCEVARQGVCLGKATSIHHRQKRSHGGTWNPSNLLHTCGDGTRGCHGWIEAHPKLANEDGLWMMSGEEPAQTSAFMRWENLMSWFLLDDEGLLHWETPHFETVKAGAARRAASERFAAERQS